MRKLERLGIAAPLGPGQWRLSENAELTMRTLGERTDIIKRMHRALTEQRIERGIGDYQLDDDGRPIVGRLVARGLDDELKGTAYAVIDGVDGRVHHVRLADLDAVSDAPLAGIVELRRYEDAAGRPRVALAVRSDLAVQAQIEANGATWLDRQLVGRTPATLSSTGFGDEVRRAIEARIEHLVGRGLAQKQGQRTGFTRDLLDNFQRRELEESQRR
jgi:hypothetical protein